VELINRDAIGGFYELQFNTSHHDFTAKSNAMSESEMTTGQTVNLTQRINDFKTQFGSEKNFYIYFFCPFIKENSESTDFKVKFDLNNNALEEGAITPKTKEELEDEMYTDNTGKEMLKKSDSKSPDTTKERWDDILNEVKSSASASLTESNMANSPSNYYSVIERKLDLKVGKDDSPSVETVNYSKKKF